VGPAAPRFATGARPVWRSLCTHGSFGKNPLVVTVHPGVSSAGRRASARVQDPAPGAAAPRRGRADLNRQRRPLMRRISGESEHAKYPAGDEGAGAPRQAIQAIQAVNAGGVTAMIMVRPNRFVEKPGLSHFLVIPSEKIR
jgi:hypothetical protein